MRLASRPVVPLLFVIGSMLGIALGGGRPAAAREPAPPRKSAAAAEAVRKALPPPSPASRLRFEGDLVLDGKWVGEVTYAAKARKFAGEERWFATEDLRFEQGGTTLRFTCAYHLKPDLSLTSGSATCVHRGYTVSIFFSPDKAGGLKLMRTTKSPSGTSVVEQLRFEAPRGVTYGRAALLLFLRGVAPAAFRRGASYALPWFPLFELATDPARAGKERKTPTSVADPRAQISLQCDPGKAAARASERVVRTTRGARATRLVLEPKRVRLKRIDAPAGSIGVVPRGSGGKRVPTPEEAPARSWRQAFLKFGYGYHMARRALIEDAFLWPQMYDYETTVARSFDAARPLEAFREAWIAEFLSRSLHRTRPDTERLLSGTLRTGKVKKQTKDDVVFAADAQFGGGVQRTYHLRRVDGLWYLWRIDF